MYEIVCEQYSYCALCSPISSLICSWVGLLLSGLVMLCFPGRSQCSGKINKKRAMWPTLKPRDRGESLGWWGIDSEGLARLHFSTQIMIVSYKVWQQQKLWLVAQKGHRAPLSPFLREAWLSTLGSWQFSERRTYCWPYQLLPETHLYDWDPWSQGLAGSRSRFLNWTAWG